MISKALGFQLSHQSPIFTSTRLIGTNLIFNLFIFNLFIFYLFLHFNVLMQPKTMKHSILSMYIDIHRVVLTMCVV